GADVEARGMSPFISSRGTVGLVVRKIDERYSRRACESGSMNCRNDAYDLRIELDPVAATEAKSSLECFLCIAAEVMLHEGFVYNRDLLRGRGVLVREFPADDQGDTHRREETGADPVLIWMFIL